MMHYLQDGQFTNTLKQIVPAWQAVTGNDRLAEFLAVPAPGSFDPSTMEWTRWLDAAHPIAVAMEADANAALGKRGLNVEQQTALGIVAHAALLATWHSDPGADWVADAVRDLAWAQAWLYWPYGLPHEAVAIEQQNNPLWQELAELLKAHQATFNYDPTRKIWFLSATDRGNGWETDDFEADNLETAWADAINYLIEYNS